RTNFDSTNASRRKPRRELDRFVQVALIHQIEDRELLFGFCKGTIGNRYLAIANANSGGSRNRLERFGSNQFSAFTQRRPASETFLVRYRVQLFFFEVNKAQIFHAATPSWACCNALMSIFVICIIACITRLALSA